jgi:hypothetical protein
MKSPAKTGSPKALDTLIAITDQAMAFRFSERYADVVRHCTCRRSGFTCAAHR